MTKWKSQEGNTAWRILNNLHSKLNYHKFLLEWEQVDTLDIQLIRMTPIYREEMIIHTPKIDLLKMEATLPNKLVKAVFYTQYQTKLDYGSNTDGSKTEVEPINHVIDTSCDSLVTLSEGGEGGRRCETGLKLESALNRKIVVEKWQKEWDCIDTGRSAHAIIPKVKRIPWFAHFTNSKRMSCNIESHEAQHSFEPV